MATINHKVFKHHKKKDGKYNVKLVVYHQKKRVYISTRHYVTDKQLNPLDLSIKDKKVLASLGRDEEEINKRVSDLGIQANRMTANELAAAVYDLDKSPEVSASEIDFITFGREYLKQLVADGRRGSANTIRPVINNLVDYFGTESVPITDITANMLRDFERYLKKDRVQKRPDQNGNLVTTLAKGMGKSGIHTTMRDLRGLFNAAKKKYNTEFNTVIRHYPFEFYKVPSAPKARKKGGDLTVDNIVALRDARLRQGSVAELARDIFMLSFYLCGMNAKDIYDHEGAVTDNGRIEYERSKTHERRTDGAFISVKVPSEARWLVDRYMNGYLRKRYSSYDNFISAIGDGMIVLGKGNKSSGKYAVEGIGVSGLTFYHARHLFATLASNECGFSTEEIARALNHVDDSHRVTAGYINYDWTLIDRIQSSVLRLIRGDEVSK